MSQKSKQFRDLDTHVVFDAVDDEFDEDEEPGIGSTIQAMHDDGGLLLQSHIGSEGGGRGSTGGSGGRRRRIRLIRGSRLLSRGTQSQLSLPETVVFHGVRPHPVRHIEKTDAADGAASISGILAGTRATARHKYTRINITWFFVVNVTFNGIYSINKTYKK